MIKIRIRHYNNVRGVEDIWLADSIKFNNDGGIMVMLDDMEFNFTKGYVNIIDMSMVEL